MRLLLNAVIAPLMDMYHSTLLSILENWDQTQEIFVSGAFIPSHKCHSHHEGRSEAIWFTRSMISFCNKQMGFIYTHVCHQGICIQQFIGSICTWRMSLPAWLPTTRTCSGFAALQSFAIISFIDVIKLILTFCINRNNIYSIQFWNNGDGSKQRYKRAKMRMGRHKSY